MSGERHYGVEPASGGRWQVTVRDRDRIVSRFYYDNQAKAEAMMEVLMASDEKQAETEAK